MSLSKAGAIISLFILYF